MSWRFHPLIPVAYAALATLAIVELSTPVLTSSGGGKIEPELFLEPDRNLADIGRELFPERASSLFFRAQQAALCQQLGPIASPECSDSNRLGVSELRELLERAVRTGNRPSEMLLYNYILILIQDRAPRSEIQQAPLCQRL